MNAFLTPDELAKVIVSPYRERLFIGGTVDKEKQTLTLYRGDLTRKFFKFSYFEPSGNGIKPDFDRFSVIDYGQTIKLGEFEAAADVLI